MSTYILLFLAGVAVGLAVGYILLSARSSRTALQARSDGEQQGRQAVQALLTETSNRLAAAQTECEMLRKHAEDERLQQAERQQEMQAAHERRMAETRAEHERRISEMQQQQE